MSSQYSKNEELANVVTHLFGVLLGLIGLISILRKGYENNDTVYSISGLIFCLSLILLYSSSTLYHITTQPNLKKKLKILDHASIFILIAGTYTPFTMVAMHGRWAWIIFGIVWTFAFIGVIFKIFYAGKFKYLSTIIYILMGWVAVIAGPNFYESLGPKALFWVVAGGLFYTFGTIFYLAKSYRYHHAIWHLFVLLGSISHYISIFFYLI